MASFKILTLALAAFACTAIASPRAGLLQPRSLNQATIWSGTDCTGTSEVVYTEVSDNYCFEGAGGNSFGDFGSTCGQGGGFVTTWSGGNCEGSSQTFEFPQGCQTIPFASIQLFCYQ